MSLTKFRAQLNYSSEECDHSTSFKEANAATANDTLLDLIRHVAWMSAVGGNAAAAAEAFELGQKNGYERRRELVRMKGLHPVPLPEEICWWFHPDFEHIDPMANCDDERGYTHEEWQQIQDLGQVDITIDTSVYVEDIEQALGRETDGEWNGWKPVPPTPEHFLMAAFDTDEVECVLWWAKRRESTISE